MKTLLFTRAQEIRVWDRHSAFQAFVEGHEQGNYFQSSGFFQFLDPVEGYTPLLIVLVDEADAIIGSLLAVYQSNGSGLKSWLSRRLIAWGGPLLRAGMDGNTARLALDQLLNSLIRHASGRAIYVEFRNFFSTVEWQRGFEEKGFQYRDHLNYLVKTDDGQAEVKKRMSSSRWRQINSSLKAGAIIEEAAGEEDVLAFYHILENLYRDKVKKPLASIDLFLRFFRSRQGKFFVVRYEGEVIGGIMCPVFAGKVIYEWYICGKDGAVKGLHPSVLATWAPIQYAIAEGYSHFDFLGAGSPEEDYGVREFKARFGGEETNFGRYSLVVNKPLYRIGKLGLQLYNKIK